MNEATNSEKIRAMQEWIDRESDQDKTVLDDSDLACDIEDEVAHCYMLLQQCMGAEDSTSVLKAIRDLSVYGSGTYGIVFRARSEIAGPVAIKMLRPSTQFSSTIRQRFELEGAALQRCCFPGIVPVLEVGKLADVPYIVMKFAEGGNLAEYLAKLPEPLPVENVVLMMRRLTETLHLAHQQGIIHRDLKPSNILLPQQTDEAKLDFEAWLCDFGLARDLSGDNKITLTGATPLVGTVAYMSPEQALGRSYETTTASDIFSLGVIFFELLTLRRPFEAESRVEILHRIVFSEAAKLRNFNRKVPAEVAAIVEKCLAKRPQHRYTSAAALAADLTAWQAGQPITAQPTTPSQMLAKWAGRNPIVASLSILLIATILTAMVVSSLLYARTQSLLSQSEQQRARADQNLELAVKAVTDFGQFVAEKTLLDVPNSNEKRLEIHLKSLDFFEQYAKQSAYDIASQKRLSIAYHYAANAAQQVPGNRELEFELRQKQSQILEKLIQQEPKNAHLHFDMFHNRFPLGAYTDGDQYYLEAEPYLRRALELAPDRETYKDALATLLVQLAERNLVKPPSTAEDYVAEAIELAKQNIARHPEKTNFHKPLIMGQLVSAARLQRQQRYAEAVEVSRGVLRYCDERFHSVDEPYSRMSFQAWGYCVLGRSYIALKDPESLTQLLPRLVDHIENFARQQSKYGREAIEPIKICLEAVELFHELDQLERANASLQDAIRLCKLETLADSITAEELNELQRLIEDCNGLLGLP